MNMRVYIESYGCAASQAETEIAAGLITKAGFELVTTADRADVIIIQSCIVKGPTEQRLLYRLCELSRRYPKKPLIVTGCAPEYMPTRLCEEFPAVSLVSTHHISKIAQAVARAAAGKRIELIGATKEIKLGLPRIRQNPVIAIVQIADGCLGECAYCATRLAKGTLFSYPRSRIISEIAAAVRAGCREVWLTAQDSAAYGMDVGKRALPELLRDIVAIPGNFFVRVGMANPDSVLPIMPELIAAFNNKKVYKFIHIPVQSGDNDILTAMGRRYNVRQFEEIVGAFRAAFRCQIWTDIIVGFPGESDTQFTATLELLKRIKPDWVNVAKFAPRTGTAAAKLPELPSELVKERSRITSALVKQLAYESNRAWIGWSGDVLITERGKKRDQWIGRNFAYKPVLVNKSGQLLGKTLKVKITGYDTCWLAGFYLRNSSSSMAATV